MLRQGLLLVSRNCPRFAPRLLSSHTVYFDSNEYATALYHKLSEKDQYKFLDQRQPPSTLLNKDQSLAASTAFAQFLNILLEQEGGNVEEAQMKQIQKEFSEMFTNWSRLSQLSVGFMMYLDSRIEADGYLVKVIKHLSCGNLYDASPHEITALLLLIYFKRNLSVEDVSEFMDIDSLMIVIAQHLKNDKMSRDEVTACCLGLKRLGGLTVNNAGLRKELYRQLEKFAPQSSPLDDFFVVTLMTTLSRGNLIFKDNIDLVAATVKTLLDNMGNLKFETAIKIFTFPLTLNVFHSEKLEEVLIERAKKEESSLNSRDLVAISNYFSKSPNKDLEMSTLDWLSEVLERRLEKATKLEELADLMDCFHYLSHRKVYNNSFNSVLSKSLEATSKASEGSNFDVKEASVKLAEALVSNLNLILEDQNAVETTLNSSKRLTALFSRIPAFLIQSWSLDTGETSIVPPSLLANLSRASHRTLPIQLYSPAMDLRSLDLRMKQLVTCYRALAKFLGSEQYCRVVRLLPHFDEPDIVFGNIGGITLTVPDNLWQQDVDGPRPAPPGDWHVLVMGTRKSLDREGRVVGQDLAKLSQLQSLGYTPLIVPITALGSPGQISSALKKLLQTTDVTLPNIDEGAMEKGRGRR